jgi:hypothetical protein
MEMIKRTYNKMFPRSFWKFQANLGKFQKNFKEISEIFYKPPVKRIAYPCNL